MVFVLWYRYWPFVVLMGAVAAVFARTLSGDFFIGADVLVNLTSGGTAIWSTPIRGLYTPVIYSLWSLMGALSQKPLVFHILNLVLHTLNSFLVYVLTKKLLLIRKKDAVELGEMGRQAFALIAALLFAIHPLQVQVVASTGEGRELLATFIGLSAMLVAWDTSDRLFPSWGAMFRRIVATGGYFLGLLTKPDLAILPIALKWLSLFTERRGLKWPMLWLWLAAGALMAGFTFELQNRSGVMRPDGLYALNEVLRTAVQFLVMRFQGFGGHGEVVTTLLGWILVVVVLAALRFFLPRAAWGGLGFFIAMLWPMIWFFGDESSGASYMALMGLSFMVSVLVAESTTNLTSRVFFVFLWIGLLGVQSFNLSGHYQSEKGLYESLVRRNPLDVRAWMKLGQLAASDLDLTSARMHFERARIVRPMDAAVEAELAKLDEMEGRWDQLLLLKSKLSDGEFLEANRAASESLAILWRQLARAEKEKAYPSEGIFNSYCASLKLAGPSPTLEEEVKSFVNDHPDLKQSLENCQSPRP